MKFPVLGISSDIAFPSRCVLVFIDGCFWHGCPLHYVLPRSRTDFWLAKLRVNVERDRRQTALLEEHGWLVVRLWEHEVWTDLESGVKRVRDALMGVHSTATTPRVIHARPLVDDLEEWTMVDLHGGEEQFIERRRTTSKWKGRAP